MVTMREIDDARTELAYWKGRRADEVGGEPGAWDFEISKAELRVNALLREWWAQGCREVEAEAAPLPGPTWEAFDEQKQRAIQAEIKLDTAHEALRVAEAERDVFRARAADSARDYDLAAQRITWDCARISELETEVARAQKEIDAATIRANEAANTASEREKIAQRNKHYLECAIERAARAEEEVKRLTFSEKSLDETNKKIHADRDRLAASIREACRRIGLHSNHGYQSALALLHDVLNQYESIGVQLSRIAESKSNSPPPPQIATREWVQEEIDRVRAEIDAVVNRAIEKHATAIFPHYRKK